jgi:CheY-like chemotaxis protein
VADGSERIVDLIILPIKDDQGRVIFLAPTGTDITDRHRAEAALREANRRKDQFLATLAHELRNPLAPLLNGLQIMRLSQRDPAAMEQARAMMERQLGQMVHLIDDLLDVSRISLGKITLRRSRVELSKIIQQAVETSRPLIDASGHQLTVELPSQSVLLDADATRLAQVVSNLLNNAAKYTEPGGRIALLVERLASEVAIRVRDNGVGIPPAMLPQVFEIFTQVDRSIERSQGGLGIGLSLVKGLVEMHGGSVEAHSSGPGQGSEFVVRLPIAESAALQPPRKPSAAELGKPGGRRVLVVDDNRDAALSLALMLKLSGHDTRTANDGLEALEMGELFQPEVVLLDIGMPRLNGYETAQRMRVRPWGRHALLVALTGWGQEEDRKLSQRAGFDTHCVKPIDPRAILTLLTDWRAPST